MPKRPLKHKVVANPNYWNAPCLSQTNIRTLQHMTAGNPLILGLGTRMCRILQYVFLWAAPVTGVALRQSLGTTGSILRAPWGFEWNPGF